LGTTSYRKLGLASVAVGFLTTFVLGITVLSRDGESLTDFETLLSNLVYFTVISALVYSVPLLTILLGRTRAAAFSGLATSVFITLLSLYFIFDFQSSFLYAFEFTHFFEGLPLILVPVGIITFLAGRRLFNRNIRRDRYEES
jgi:hypothetical protein